MMDLDDRLSFLRTTLDPSIYTHRSLLISHSLELIHTVGLLSFAVWPWGLALKHRTMISLAKLIGHRMASLVGKTQRGAFNWPC